MSSGDSLLLGRPAAGHPMSWSSICVVFFTCAISLSCSLGAHTHDSEVEQHGSLTCDTAPLAEQQWSTGIAVAESSLSLTGDLMHAMGATRRTHVDTQLLHVLARHDAAAAAAGTRTTATGPSVFLFTRMQWLDITIVYYETDVIAIRYMVIWSTRNRPFLSPPTLTEERRRVKTPWTRVKS